MRIIIKYIFEKYLKYYFIRKTFFLFIFLLWTHKIEQTRTVVRRGVETKTHQLPTKSPHLADPPTLRLQFLHQMAPMLQAFACPTHLALLPNSRTISFCPNLRRPPAVPPSTFLTYQVRPFPTLKRNFTTRALLDLRGGKGYLAITVFNTNSFVNFWVSGLFGKRSLILCLLFVWLNSHFIFGFM